MREGWLGRDTGLSCIVHHLPQVAVRLHFSAAGQEKGTEKKGEEK